MTKFIEKILAASSPSTKAFADASLKVLLAVFAATVLTAPIDYLLGDITTYTFYFLAIVVIGLRYGIVALLACAILSALTYSFFFADPIFSFRINKPEVVFALVTFTVLAIATGQVMTRVRNNARKLNEAHDALTERSRELESALNREKQIKRTQDQFVATICHEFRTPITIPNRDGITTGKSWNIRFCTFKQV